MVWTQCASESATSFSQKSQCVDDAVIEEGASEIVEVFSVVVVVPRSALLRSQHLKISVSDRK